ncbi:OsmC family protein [Promineifilum sp.]|uniref:OsmC family protein n=1 Tax=Promineifilum sp. TaxID=2664178 RepID=UPI0035B0E36A
MSNVAIKWMEEGSRLFACRDSLGNMVISGSWPREDPTWQEWRAAKPSDLLLMALASCAAHDVVAILERQRQILTGLQVNVNGRQAPEPPYTFTDIHLHFILQGNGLDPAKVERALDLSINKYCSVAATVRGVAALSHDYEILP